MPIPSQVFRRILTEHMNGGRPASADRWDYHHISASYIQDDFKMMVPTYRQWYHDLMVQLGQYNASKQK